MNIWDEVITINLHSVYLCTRAALRGMLRRKFGRVVSTEVGRRAGQQQRPSQLRRLQGRHRWVPQIGGGVDSRRSN